MKTIKTSIRKKVERPVMILMAGAILVLGICGSVLNLVGVQATLSRNLPVIAEFATQAVSKELTGAISVVEVSGSIARLSSSESSWASKEEILDGFQKKYNWLKWILRDADGNDMSPWKMEYDATLHLMAMEGETVISDPQYDTSAGRFVIVVCTPLWDKGLRDTKIVGTVTAVIDGEELCDIMSDLAVGEGGYAYMLDSKGNMVAHTNSEAVLTSSNKIQAAEASGKWSKHARYEQDMVNQGSGYGSYTDADTGEWRLIAYVPVEMNSWSMAISVPYSDYNNTLFLSMFVTLILMALMMLLATAIAKKIGNKITNPIEICAKRLHLLAEGNLSAPVEEIDTDDEILWLAESTKLIVNQMNTIISDIDYLLMEMSKGDFTVHTRIGDDAYVGDFKQLLLSMRQLNTRLKETLSEINEGSRQVEAGALQMAESAQSLAEGATDQAGSVEELLANITDVSGHVEKNNTATNQVYERASKVVEEARIGQQKMEELSAAMEKIEESSNQISHIIENIEEIASETNLLSLNAAIEAARAGEAGKGFSVVADQIRKLAEQSSKSAVDTRELIGTSIEVVNSGGVITKDTAAYLNKVIEGIQEIMDSMENVQESSNKQAAVINDIEMSVQQISQVVESNSASAQEGSATSEELSAQAESLGSLISRFRLE